MFYKVKLHVCLFFVFFFRGGFEESNGMASATADQKHIWVQLGEKIFRKDKFHNKKNKKERKNPTYHPVMWAQL